MKCSFVCLYTEGCFQLPAASPECCWDLSCGNAAPLALGVFTRVQGEFSSPLAA